MREPRAGDAAWSRPPTLTGPTVRLEPLRPDHADALFAAADEQTFRYLLTVPESWTPAAFRSLVERMVAMPDRASLAMIDRATGTPIGATAFLEIRPEHRTIEIGATWISPVRRGTHVNPEVKLLMLRHAFETLGADRVQLKCDARNQVSQRAIAALGAVREGTLRSHLIAPDGQPRDTVVYSILSAEWPGVRDRLVERLAQAGHDVRPGARTGAG